ncbi:hypothetical protein [Solimicrobium silvestre]|uniref:Uncharacterized protein n=1 Tax=Solimicrobium silvestre TaxID=2099400 RepID=A0A2S9GYZ7_9BURK|nr:hypothetical protein [Solimicrobium silvestre]PRC92933.1 hypothetical protein S2091_2350 [Solimicrobium silvestre]
MSTITSSAPASPFTPPAYVNPVASSSTYAGLSTTATKLGLESSIVANLGSSSSGTPLYNAVGLLNSIITAGQPAAPSSATSTGSAGATPPASTSGIYTASGTVQGTSTNLNANWATILKSEPATAGTVAADSTIQGILSSISTTA